MSKFYFFYLKSGSRERQLDSLNAQRIMLMETYRQLRV